MIMMARPAVTLKPKRRTCVTSPPAGLPDRPDAPVKRRRDAPIGHRAAVLLHTPHKGMQRLGSERLGRCEPIVAAFLWCAPAHGDVLHEPCVGVRPVQGRALGSLTVVEQGDVALFSHT